MDLVKSRALFATQGRDAGTVGRFADQREHGHDPERIGDISPAFTRRIDEHLPTRRLVL